MDETAKRRVKVITIITLILLVLAIFLAFVKEKQDQKEQEEGSLPDIEKADYTPLQTADDDFLALEESINSLG